MAGLREQCDISTEHSHQGGQHVGRDVGVITITHRDTGISLKLPAVSERSQHKRILAGLDALEYLLASV